MQKLPKGLGFLQMKMLAYDTQGRLSFTMGDVPRFYNRNYYHYDGAIHEQVKLIENPDKNREAFLMPVVAIHQGYAIKGDEMKKKQERNIDLIRAALENEPDNDYLHFQYAQSLFIMGDYQGAIERFEKAMSLIKDFGKSYTSLCVMGLAKSYCKAGRIPDAIELMAKYENYYQLAQYAYIQGTSYLDDDQPLKALFYLIKAVNMKDAVTMGENLADSYRFIMEIYHSLGQHDMAKPYEQKFEECMKEKARVLDTMGTETA